MRGHILGHILAHRGEAFELSSGEQSTSSWKGMCHFWRLRSFRKICGFKSFGVFNPDILIPCVSVLLFLKQGSNLGIKTYRGWEFNLWNPATLVIESWASCLDFPAAATADTFQSLLAVSQEVLYSCWPFNCQLVAFSLSLSFSRVSVSFALGI